MTCNECLQPRTAHKHWCEFALERGEPREPRPAAPEAQNYPSYLCQGCGKYLFGRTTGTCNWCGHKIGVST